MSAGAEHSDPSLDRPPRFVHLLILGGQLARQPPFRWPAGTTTPIRDGLRSSDRPRALSLGRRPWGDHPGELVLAPPFGAGGIAGNHLVFRWHEGTSYYAITLHSWEPFTETVAVLQALVESTG